ncbi:MAG: hypothetical protein JO088_08355 [Acidobacteria bacterium]|nr:hypothetical protein [Acidobacteriota bacterium]
MEKFLSRYHSLITAVLPGFDRVVFHGILQRLMRHDGMYFMLKDADVRLLDFKKFAIGTTEQVKQASLAEAQRNNRPILYLRTANVDKQKLARKILAENPVEQGLICVFKAMEPCMTFEYQRSANREERGLRLHPGKCLHLYHYWLDPRFGFMNARIQTWFPFNIQICINGREWLARQLLRKGQSNFKRADNCFTWMGNPKLAQRLMDEQLRTDWPRALNAIARSLNPQHQTIFRCSPMNYYWTAYQTELATDVLFQDPQSLSEVYAPLVRYAMGAFKSEDVMRFLAQKAPGNFAGEIVTSFKDRAEGVRVKHWVGGNSIKMYDKAGSVLRVETTIGDPTDFKVFRPLHHKPNGKLQWLPMRKGVADLYRRTEVSGRSNHTYFNALAAVGQTRPCSKIFDAVSRPVTDCGRRVRALRLADPDDLALLQAIARGEFAISGFRNRDIRKRLYPSALTELPDEQRRLAARISRLLRILRAHGLIQKIQKTTRYRLTDLGQTLTAAIFATRNADIAQLLSKPA